MSPPRCFPNVDNAAELTGSGLSAQPDSEANLHLISLYRLRSATPHGRNLCPRFTHLALTGK